MPIHHNKHVRFAYKNTFHSPPVTPPVPPLTFSSSTVPSSLGAITPPSASFSLPMPPSALRPYPIPDTPLTPSHGEYTRPHPYLDAAGISWDLMDHPSTISRHHQSLSSRIWKEPATTPPLPFIVITVSNFPWKFKVSASNHAFVTFEDVVSAIYSSLRKNITESEFHTVALTDQRRASRSYEQRYRRQRSTKLYEEEKRGGMKRVDFLMERTRFAGLSNRSRRPDEWHLSVT